MANCQADNADYLHFIEMIKHRLPNTKFEFFEIPPPYHVFRLLQGAYFHFTFVYRSIYMLSIYIFPPYFMLNERLQTHTPCEAIPWA